MPGILLLALLALGCGREPVAGGLLVPVQRLLDQRPADLPPAAVWGEPVRLAGEQRLAIARRRGESAAVVGAPPDAASTSAAWSLQVPETLRAAPWLLVRPSVSAEGTIVAPLPDRFLASAKTGPVLLIDAAGRARHPAARVVAMLVAVDALDATDVESAPFVVPPGAVVTAGMGIEEEAWHAAGAPVEFRIVVAVEGGAETIVHRARLDPAGLGADRAWRDARADLSAFAGRSVRLKLATAPADPDRPGTSLPMWADPVVLAPARAHLPNVVLVSLDTLRAKSVSTYPHAPRPTMPHLTELVGDAGAVFDRAYTTAPHTLPAHLSLFTGRDARMTTGIGPLRRLDPDVPTLPERLRAAGYETAAFTENGFVVPRVGFERGFASYRENTSPDFHSPVGHAADTFRGAADWLASRRDRPVFLFVHTYEVHSPYTPRAPYHRAFETGIGIADPHALQLLRYEQEARYLDDELRAFLDALDGLGLGTRTLLVVTSDHGEEFMEHGALEHGHQLYDEAIHVPLLMRLPGVVPRGLRVATPVSLVDVAPTILELVGAPPLVGVDGESLVPLLAGGTLSAHRRAVFSEAASTLISGVDLLSVRMPDVHCIYRTRLGTHECYDPAVDPDERRPLRGNDPRPAAATKEAVAYTSLRPPARRTTAGAELVEELVAPDDEARREKLRSLGYVE